jgi:hypothetical protein
MMEKRLATSRGFYRYSRLSFVTVVYNCFKPFSQWDIDTNHSEYEYFMEFINTVVYTAPDKLYVFLIFISDDRLKEIDLLDLVKQVGFNFF